MKLAWLATALVLAASPALAQDGGPLDNLIGAKVDRDAGRDAGVSSRLAELGVERARAERIASRLTPSDVRYFERPERTRPGGAHVAVYIAIVILCLLVGCGCYGHWH
jgi:hypothetical protein